jgi:hypothetical protein
MPRWWADQVAILARELASQADLPATLDAIVKHASTSIEGAEFAAITVKAANGSSYRTVAATDQLPMQEGRVQYEAVQGPCLTALERPIPAVATPSRSMIGGRGSARRQTS